MSFFDQDNAIMEIELTKPLVQQWRHRISKDDKLTAKLAAKLEWRNNNVELHIIDERAHSFRLSGFTQRSEINLMVQGLEPIGILQYKCKGFGDDSAISNLSNQFQTLGKDEKNLKQMDEDVEDENHIFQRHKLQLQHKTAEKVVEGFKTFDLYEKDNIQRELIKFLKQYQEGVTIQFLQQNSKFRYSRDDLHKKLLQDITDRRKVKNETKYYLKVDFLNQQ